MNTATAYPYTPTGKYAYYPRGPIVSDVAIVSNNGGGDDGLMLVIAGKVNTVTFSSSFKQVSRLFFRQIHRRL